MVTVTFQADSYLQLRKEMHNFLGLDAPSMPKPPVSQPRPDEHAGNGVKPFEINVSAPVPEKKRTRRTKAEIEADKATKTNGEDVFQTKTHDAKAEASEDSESASPLPQSTGALIVNKEAVHQALQQVNISAGLPKAREILQSFGVNRISEIKESDFKSFIEKCNEATMMA